MLTAESITTEFKLFCDKEKDIVNLAKKFYAFGFFGAAFSSITNYNY